jgi:hypothetical protein
VVDERYMAWTSAGFWESLFIPYSVPIICSHLLYLRSFVLLSGAWTARHLSKCVGSILISCLGLDESTDFTICKVDSQMLVSDGHSGGTK